MTTKSGDITHTQVGQGCMQAMLLLLSKILFPVDASAHAPRLFCDMANAAAQAPAHSP